MYKTNYLRSNIEALIASEFTGYRIHKETNISLSVIQKILDGTSKLDNISLKNAEKLSNYWEENKMKSYDVALQKVRDALKDGVTFNLAVAYTQENDGEVVEQMVAEQLHEAANGVEKFDMTVDQYLFELLEIQEETTENSYMKGPDAFDKESDAEREGFYWEDSLSRWLKLDINK